MLPQANSMPYTVSTVPIGARRPLTPMALSLGTSHKDVRSSAGNSSMDLYFKRTFNQGLAEIVAILSSTRQFVQWRRGSIWRPPLGPTPPPHRSTGADITQRWASLTV